MLYQYKADDAATCLASQNVVFIGDSVTRQLYFQFIHSLDASLPASPPDDEHKHMDYRFTTTHDTGLLFYWDPFLNTSATETYIHSPVALPPLASERINRPALLVSGTGLWYLRYATTSGGLPSWVSTIEAVLQSVAREQAHIADAVVMLPVENVVSSKLSPDRASTMRDSDIDAMNSDLVHRIRPPSLADPFSFFPSAGTQGSSVFFPSVFNEMLDSSQTEDGLHFSDAVVQLQATVLMNLRCNEVMPKTFPLDKTCCRSYPWPQPLHLLVLGAFILWGPVACFLTRRYSKSCSSRPVCRKYSLSSSDARPMDESLIPKEQLPFVVISAAVAVIYVADRTGFWLKEQKQFSPWTFTFLCLLSLGIGLLTVKRADKDLGFLNRDQTDEWKGWMQSTSLWPSLR